MRDFRGWRCATDKRLNYRAKPTRTVLRVEVLEGRLMLHGDGDDPFAPDVPLLPVDLQALLDLEAAARAR